MRLNKLFTVFVLLMLGFVKLVAAQVAVSADDLNRLVSVLYAEKRYDEALELAQKALAATEGEDEENKKFRQVALSNLGILHYVLKDYEKAAGFFEQALKLLEEEADKNSQAIDETVQFLAVCYREEGDLQFAEEFSRRALERVEQKYGKDSKESFVPLTNLGLVLLSEQQTQETEVLFKRATEIALASYGEQSYEAVTAQHNLALVLTQQGEYEEALKLYEKIIPLRKTFQKDDPLGLPSSLLGQGTVYRLLEQYTQAEALIRQALTLWQEHYGSEDHPYAGPAFHQLAQIAHAKREYPKATDEYEKAIKIWSNYLAPNHPDLVLVKNNYEQLKKDQLAKQGANASSTQLH